MTEPPSVHLSRPSAAVAVVTIDNPARLGALTPAIRRMLGEHWEAIGENPDVRAVVLTGTGRGFSTGLDVAAANDGDDPQAWYGGDDADEIPAFGMSPLDFDVWLPLIVAVNGVCAGGGFHLLSDADIVIASEDATFLDPHTSVGQVAALEPIALLRRLPMEAVLRMVVLGRHGHLTAADALRLGLVSEVLPRDRLLDRAVELAEAAAENSPAAIEASKRVIHESLNLGLDDALRNGWGALRQHWNHPDTREGLAAFAEGRPPQWEPVDN